MIINKTKKYNNHDIATAFHDAGTKKIVIFCHGYRGTSVGPSRFFVRVANTLQEFGISSLRFDQYGSGNSEGNFYDSSFNDWVNTAKAIAEEYLEQGYKVALFGQSMGSAAAIFVGSELSSISSIVAWVPDPNVEPFEYPDSGCIEEGGQRVQASYWQEAHDQKIADRLANVKSPTYIVQCTADEYVNVQNRNAITQNAQAHHIVDVYEGYAHSNWSYNQAEEIIKKSVNFIKKSLE